MTQGIVLCAYNNKHIDYAKLVSFNSIHIKEKLNKPILVITDEETRTSIKKYDNRIDDFFIKPSEEKQLRRFKNGFTDVFSNDTRTIVVTPFEETLVIDVDYLVYDDTLKYVWNSPVDIRLNKQVKYIDSMHLCQQTYIHPASIPLYWATVFYFRQGSISDKFFSIISHLKKNYVYYSNIYKYNYNLYRNDYLYSMAVHMLSGYMETYEFVQPLPVPFLIFSEEDHIITKMDSERMIFNTLKDVPVNYRCDASIHVMNKFSLQESI